MLPNLFFVREEQTNKEPTSNQNNYSCFATHALPWKQAPKYKAEAMECSLECSYCTFVCYDSITLMKHIKNFHEHDPRFCVSCALCGQAYSKWDSLKKHLQRRHKTVISSGSFVCSVQGIEGMPIDL